MASKTTGKRSFIITSTGKTKEAIRHGTSVGKRWVQKAQAWVSYVRKNDGETDLVEWFDKDGKKV